MEKALGGRTVLRGETAYVGYAKESWVGLPDEERVRVPVELSGSEVEVSVGLVWSF